MAVMRTPPVLSNARLDALPWACTAGPFRALGHEFVVRTMDVALGRYLEAVLDPFVDGDASPLAYSVVDRGEATKNRYALYFGRERLALTHSGSFAVATLLWHVNRGAISSGSREFVLVHAGAVEWAGRAVVFPAPMESGKTTLVAGMVRAGARYLSDEAAAIEPQTLLVHPFPKALTIGAGSWGVLADLAPKVDPQLARYMRDDWHIDARAIRPDCLAPPSAPSFVIAPTYVRNATTSLEPMTRADAVMHLGQNSFNLTEHGRRGLDVLAAVARRSTCHRLVVGDLDEACELVSRVLSDAQ
jgi:hypothetical protein